MAFFFWLTLVLFVFVCVFLILLILIQKGRGGGLASAFGGAGGNTAFGSKTGDVLTWATSIVFGVFLVLAVALNLLATQRNEQVEAGTLITAPTVQPPPAPTPMAPPVAPMQQAAPTSSPATQP